MREILYGAAVFLVAFSTIVIGMAVVAILYDIVTRRG